MGLKTTPQIGDIVTLKTNANMPDYEVGSVGSVMYVFSGSNGRAVLHLRMEDGVEQRASLRDVQVVERAS